jgi:hypothetical protein
MVKFMKRLKRAAWATAGASMSMKPGSQTVFSSSGPEAMKFLGFR